MPKLKECVEAIVTDLRNSKDAGGLELTEEQARPLRFVLAKAYADGYADAFNDVGATLADATKWHGKTLRDDFASFGRDQTKPRPKAPTVVDETKPIGR